jgi:hypothetical protein
VWSVASCQIHAQSLTREPIYGMSGILLLAY